MARKLTKKIFTTWLKAQHQNKRIKTGCSTNCPIAICLLDRGEKLYKSGWIYRISNWPRGKWVDNFIVNIDRRGSNKTTWKVSPKECLEILKNC